MFKKCIDCEYWHRWKDLETGRYEEEKHCIYSHSENFPDKTEAADGCENYNSRRARNENFI